MLQTDCKFLNEYKSKCNALKELYCKIENKPCKFYKPIDKSNTALKSEKRR